MCGIVGHISNSGIAKYDLVSRMINAVKHRGPDENGIWHDENCVLGHARLSIVDLDSGSQPMVSTDGRFVIVFNGEIYGYRELKAMLCDYNFRTNSDTEVIIAAYEKYGVNCLQYIHGMFSFAIWDIQNKILFAARDRFGEKPFFYNISNNGSFTFSSEVKAIKCNTNISFTLDECSIVHYMNYLFIPPGRCIFKNISPLPPAHYLIYNDGVLNVLPYWKIPTKRLKISYDEGVEYIKYLLNKSVEKQLIADVPVGAFLSGGLDSTTIVALACDKVNKLSTFSFGFEGGNNELKYAKAASLLYKTNHHELHSEKLVIADELIKMINIFDEPFADSSSIPTIEICRLASQYMKVILTGDGADELFGGYDWWYQSLIERGRKGNLLSKIFGTYNKKIITNYERSPLFSNDEIQSIIPGISISKDKFIPTWDITNDINDILNYDLSHYMPGDILVKTDRSSMAFGLELRAPFLDVDLTEFVSMLPPEWKVVDGHGKHIMRDAFSNLWPECIVNRGKQGFGAPVGDWMKDNQVRSLYYDSVKTINNGLIDSEKALKYLDDGTYKPWTIIVFALWLNKWYK